MRLGKIWSSLGVLATALTMWSAPANAALITQSDGTVWDNVSHLIWLKDWNQNGRMNWAGAKAWAAGLTFAGSSDWRLPTADGNQSAGPANEFLQVWSQVGASLAGLQTYFDNVQPDPYWSETDIAGPQAWVFRADNGDPGQAADALTFFAVAVRSGDVVTAVPEPESLMLVLAGLAAAGVVRRRRPRLGVLFSYRWHS